MVRFEIGCPECGPVEIGTGHLACTVDRRRESGLCEARCPGCGLRLFVRTTPAGVRMALAHGVRRLAGSAPFELFEERGGAPLSWDDLLDLHDVLARTDLLELAAS